MKNKFKTIEEFAQYILDLREDENVDGFDFIDKVCEVAESVIYEW